MPSVLLLPRSVYRFKTPTVPFHTFVNPRVLRGTLYNQKTVYSSLMAKLNFCPCVLPADAELPVAVWPEVEQAEHLARGAALKWASGVFCRPEHLERLSQYRKRESQRTTSIHSRLKVHTHTHINTHEIQHASDLSRGVVNGCIQEISQEHPLMLTSHATPAASMTHAVHVNYTADQNSSPSCLSLSLYYANAF